MGWTRRRFLGSAAAFVAAPGCALRVPHAPATPAAYLVPGYRSDVALHRGGAARESPELRRTLPAGWDGPVTLVTRLDERHGGVRRTLLPLDGHAISVAHGGERAVWSSLNGDTLVAFDPETLALDRVVAPVDGHVCGGHQVQLPDGGPWIVAERRAFGPYQGAPERHYGALVLRDPTTLAEIGRVSCHGISPHEIGLLDDGRHVAVANYGHVEPPRAGGGYGIVETSLTVVELATGRIVYRHVPTGPGHQVRHLAAHRLDRLLALLVHNVPNAAMPGFFGDRPDVYEPDLTSDADVGYFPAPLVRCDARTGEARAVWAADRAAMRQGQSVVYDAARDQWIATFASAHRIVVVDGATGAVRHVVRTDAFGLRYPRGIALHPDGEHYAVAGSWRDLAVLRRADHRRVRTHHTLWFDHSHLTACAA